MATRRWAIPVVAVMVVLAVSCGADVGDDGLPTHCGEWAHITVDGWPDAASTEKASFEDVVRARLAQDLPNLKVAFPSSGAPSGSPRSDSIHLLRMTDTGVGHKVTLTNANGVKMLQVDADLRDGAWFVGSVEFCRSMQNKFGNA